MPDFWRSSGWHLLAPLADGRLAVTDDFLRAYLRRAELAPMADSAPAERALHAALLAQPRSHVADGEIAALDDPDLRHNWRAVLRFRDRLLAHDSIEAAYLALFAGARFDLPPAFIDHLAHAILRQVLDGTADALEARAGELLFRSQRAGVEEGAVLLADEETLEAAGQARVDLDVLSPANADAYWRRSDDFDMVLDLTFGRHGPDALCRVLRRWVGHFLGEAVAITPVQSIRDERWRWHIGLDAESTALLNDLYAGRAVAPDRLGRLLALFRLEFADTGHLSPEMAGRPVYLGLAMDGRGVVRLKPQNLLFNLPLLPAVPQGGRE